MFNVATKPTNSNNGSTAITNKSTLPKLEDVKKEIAAASTSLDIGKYLERIPTKNMLGFSISKNIELRRQILSAANKKLADDNISQLYLKGSALSDEDFLLLSNLSNSKVTHLDISDNEITKIPETVFTMRALITFKYEPNQQLKLSQPQKNRVSDLLQKNKIPSMALINTSEQNLSASNTTSSAIQVGKQSVHPMQHQIEVENNEKMAALTAQIDNSFRELDRLCLEGDDTHNLILSFKQFKSLIYEINSSLSKCPTSAKLIADCKSLIIQKVISSTMNLHVKYKDRPLNEFLYYPSYESIILPILFIAYLSSSRWKSRSFVLKIDFAEFKKPLQDKLGNKTHAECLGFMQYYSNLPKYNLVRNIPWYSSDEILDTYKKAQQYSEVKNGVHDEDLAACRIKFYLLALCQRLINMTTGNDTRDDLLSLFSSPAYTYEFFDLAQQILDSFSEAGPITT